VSVTSVYCVEAAKDTAVDTNRYSRPLNGTVSMTESDP